MHSGSTSVLLFLVDETLICSNIGDSQCYLFNCSNEDLWTFESLAKIHKPSNEEEKKRIIESGGEVHPYFDEDGIYDGPDRVYAKNQSYPGLSLSRSIGDLDGKAIGVISDPDIIVKKIDENSKFKDKGYAEAWPLFFVPSVEILLGYFQIIMMLADIGHALALQFSDSLWVIHQRFQGLANTFVCGRYIDNRPQVVFMNNLVVLRFSTTNTDNAFRHGQQRIHRGGVAV